MKPISYPSANVVLNQIQGYSRKKCKGGLDSTLFVPHRIVLYTQRIKI